MEQVEEPQQETFIVAENEVVLREAVPAAEAENKAAEEVQKKPAQRKRAKKSTSGEQYLFALFSCAEWISEEYKELAKSHAGQSELLKELYMCACDNVEWEKAEEALEHTPPEHALHAIRQKKIEEDVLKERTDEMEGVFRRTAELEKQMENVSRTIEELADHLQGLPAAFPEPAITEEAGLQNVPESGTGHGKKEDVPESGTKAGNAIRSVYRKTQKCVSGRRKTKKTARFLAALKKEGYSGEQMEFVIDCLEEGMPLSEVRQLAVSPQLPADIMAKIKRMQQQTGKEGK